MRELFLLLALVFAADSIAGNPAIIFGSGGYAKNLATSGIELDSGLQINDQGTYVELDAATRVTGLLEAQLGLTVTGTTTLDTGLTGPLKTTAGVISAGAIDVATDITGVLPIANGGTNSSTALTNDLVMVSSGDAIVEASQLPAIPSAYMEDFGVLTNPKFEEGVNGWTNNNCSISNVNEVTALGQSAEITCTAQALDFSQTSTSFAGLDGKQGLAVCKVKSDFNYTFKVLSNGADQVEKPIVASTDFKFIELPFTFGSTSNAIKLESAASTGAVIVDDCDLQIMPEGYIKEISNEVSDWVDYTPTSNLTTNVIHSAKYRRVGESIEVTGKISFTGANNDSGGVNISLPSGLTRDLAKSDADFETSIGQATFVDVGTASLRGVVTTPNTTTVNLRYFSDSGLQEKVDTANMSVNIPFAVTSGDYFYYEFKMPIVEFSNTTATIVKQDAELFSASRTLTANVTSAGVVSELTITGLEVGKRYRLSGKAFVNEVGSGNGEKELNYKIFNGTAEIENSPSYSRTTFFRNQVPISSVFIAVDTTVTFNVNYLLNTMLAGSTTSYDPYTATYMTITEEPLSKTITGKFEGINETTLAVVEASGNAGQSLTANVTDIPFIETKDDNNLWDGSKFTAPRDNYYSIEGGVSTGTGAAGFYTYVNGARKHRAGNTIFDVVGNVKDIVFLNAGDELSIRSDAAQTLNNDIETHFLTIKEEPDKEAIVRNLAADQVILTQRKTLTTNVTTTGVVAEFTFNNLEIGKKYALNGNLFMDATQTSAQDKYFLVEITGTDRTGDGKLYGTRTGYSVNDIFNSVTPSIKMFTATSTSITVDVLSVSFMKMTNGSWLELTELPETYQETTKF